MKNNIRSCKDYGDINKAKVLFIGHDPTLRKSSTIAEYCLFADYHNKKEILNNSDMRKKELADSVYKMISDLTNNKYTDDEIYLTNLCNEELALGKEETYIPVDKAYEGIHRIVNLLSNGHFEYIFAASLQVNYWLQKLNFYSSNNSFLKDTRISPTALKSIPKYFKVTKSKTFQEICGQVFELSEYKVKIIPVLHPKNYPLERNKNIKDQYYMLYEKIKKEFIGK